MNKKFALLLAFSLTGCGGSGGGGSNPPAAPLAPIPVSITRSGTGCLLSSNADAEANYVLGAMQAKTLLWSCANISALTRVGVEAFYTFDNANQCFLEQAVAWKAGDCSMRATAPASPALSASVRTVNPPTMYFIGSGTYALNLDAEVTVTGNLTAFGPALALTSLPSHFGAQDATGNPSLSGVPYILPLTGECLRDPTSFQACSGQKAIHVFMPITSTSTTTGQHYTFTLTVLDFFRNGIGSTTFELTAP